MFDENPDSPDVTVEFVEEGNSIVEWLRRWVKAILLLGVDGKAKEEQPMSETAAVVYRRENL